MFHEILYCMLTRNHVENHDDLPVWVIGDVHGCADQFRDVVNKIHAKTPDCIIFQLGDLIDRGPDVYDAFRIVKEHDIKTCIGNHELNFIQEWFGYKECRSRARCDTHDHIKQLSQKKQDMILESMLDMQNFYTVEVGSSIWTLSHAPIRTETDLFEDCGAGNTYCMSTKPYDKSMIDAFCVHGHMHWNYRDIKEQIQDHEQLWYNIDGGACYGGELIALELKTFDTIRVTGIQYTKHGN